jgi:hypothetical protein
MHTPIDFEENLNLLLPDLESHSPGLKPVYEDQLLSHGCEYLCETKNVTLDPM